MSESPSNGNGNGNAFTVKELLIRLEGRFDEHARSVQTSMTEMSRVIGRHDEALKVVEANSNRLETLEDDKLVRDTRSDERGRIVRLAFGTSILSVISTVIAIMLAVMNMQKP